MSDIRSIVTEDWQRDALRVVLVNHTAHQVAMVTTRPYVGTPMLEMTLYDPQAMTSADEQEAGILLPLAVARELYQALGRHFGDHQDPGSRELVDHLKATVEREAIRVDQLLVYATQPPVVVAAERQ